ncbi:galactose-specific lectin nattectin-like [Thalassophryne amazonica]|uniref:galactose-specific lectin nattectin-like n=1 Tax=Thalassophryne amazonica TaxID=390379 RepID=UPI0014720BA9|nr:galactose-specific lectin nattectin-like [Thalassophryne amazonica]
MKLCSDHCCARCPYGWIRYGNRCYMFFYQQMTWAQAERYCTHRGGNLASIPDDGVLDFLRGYVYRVTGAYRQVWLGGHDAVEEGIWMWSNGDRFYFKKWAKGQPNNGGRGEHCMEMNYKGQYVNDTCCGQRRHFFCARNL